MKTMIKWWLRFASCFTLIVGTMVAMVQTDPFLLAVVCIVVMLLMLVLFVLADKLEET